MFDLAHVLAYAAILAWLMIMTAAGLRGSVKTPIGVRRQFSRIHLLSLLEGL